MKGGSGSRSLNSLSTRSRQLLLISVSIFDHRLEGMVSFDMGNKLVICSVGNIFTTDEISKIKEIYENYKTKINYVQQPDEPGDSSESEQGGSDYEYFEFGASKSFKLNTILKFFIKILLIN